MSLFILTPAGKIEADKTRGSGPRYAIISFMSETDGPVDFEEIVGKLNTSEEKANMLLKGMLNEQSPLIKEA